MGRPKKGKDPPDPVGESTPKKVDKRGAKGDPGIQPGPNTSKADLGTPPSATPGDPAEQAGARRKTTPGDPAEQAGTITTPGDPAKQPGTEEEEREDSFRLNKSTASSSSESEPEKRPTHLKSYLAWI